VLFLYTLQVHSVIPTKPMLEQNSYQTHFLCTKSNSLKLHYRDPLDDVRGKKVLVVYPYVEL